MPAGGDVMRKLSRFIIFLLFASLLMAGFGSLRPDSATAADAYYTVNVDARREHIKDRYEEINSNIGKYKRIKGYPYYLEENSGLSSWYDKEHVTSWIDNNGTLVKSIVKVPDRDLTVEIYHERLGCTGLSKNSACLEDTVIFAFAYDNSGNEYRIYFDNSSYRIIRYVDNLKNIHDFPEGLNYMEFVQEYNEGSDGAAREIISAVSPGWWTAYEHAD